jgi:hypothetical protein
MHFHLCVASQKDLKPPSNSREKGERGGIEGFFFNLIEKL